MQIVSNKKHLLFLSLVSCSTVVYGCGDRTDNHAEAGAADATKPGVLNDSARDDLASSILHLNIDDLKTANRSKIENNVTMRVTEGQGGVAEWVVAYQSADERLTVDVSTYDKFEAELRNWPVDEVMVILEGEVEIIDYKGRAQLFSPGDVLLMPKGFNGIWRQTGPIRKVAVSYTPAN